MMFSKRQHVQFWLNNFLICYQFCLSKAQSRLHNTKRNLSDQSEIYTPLSYHQHQPPTARWKINNWIAFALLRINIKKAVTFLWTVNIHICCDFWEIALWQHIYCNTAGSRQALALLHAEEAMYGCKNQNWKAGMMFLASP